MAARKSSTVPGDKLGFLTVLEVIPRSRKANTPQRAICRCECGSVKTYALQQLRQGFTKSCGCQRAALISKAISTHGRTDTRAFRIWSGMLNRCRNARDPGFLRYGARGIKVCEARESSFETFLADMGEPPAGTSLDRIAIDGNYEPDNCRWASRDVQASNRSTNRFVELDGVRLTLSQAARSLGVSHQTVSNRIFKGLLREVP